MYLLKAPINWNLKEYFQHLSALLTHSYANKGCFEKQPDAEQKIIKTALKDGKKKKKNNADFACGLKDNLQDDNMGIKQYNSPCKLK